MNYREYQQIARRKSRQIHVGNVTVGGDAPITVQTMTNTLTTDVDAHRGADPARRSGGRGYRPRLLPGPRKARWR